jgi:hypothetical protein
MTKSIFSNLPNNLIMNIIKMAEDERKKEREQYEKERYEDELMDDPEYRYETRYDYEANEWDYDWGDDDEPSWACE